MSNVRVPDSNHESTTANTRLGVVFFVLALLTGLGVSLGLESMAQHRIASSGVNGR